ncbi:hypothetical protein PGB90_001362 [Kerria lacca]
MLFISTSAFFLCTLLRCPHGGAFQLIGVLAGRSLAHFFETQKNNFFSSNVLLVDVRSERSPSTNNILLILKQGFRLPIFDLKLSKCLSNLLTVSVAVSVLTLTFISVDRWYAICFPLKFKSTTTRAKISIIFIWIVSLLLDIPELIVLETKPRLSMQMETNFFTQCVPAWSVGYEIMYQVAKIILLYTVPLLFMSVAYCQIVRVLWTSDNIPGHTETLKMMNNSALYHNDTTRRMALASATNTTESQLRSRRKAAKMLVAVVIMFALCYFPVHLLNILRYLVDVYQTDITAALSNLTHWLCYANSAINPIIYNFMSGKFRREFKRAFKQCHPCARRERRIDVDLVSQNDYTQSLNRRTSQSYAFENHSIFRSTQHLSSFLVSVRDNEFHVDASGITVRPKFNYEEYAFKENKKVQKLVNEASYADSLIAKFSATDLLSFKKDIATLNYRHESSNLPDTFFLGESVKHAKAVDNGRKRVKNQKTGILSVDRLQFKDILLNNDDITNYVETQVSSIPNDLIPLSSTTSSSFSDSTSLNTSVLEELCSIRLVYKNEKYSACVGRSSILTSTSELNRIKARAKKKKNC